MSDTFINSAGLSTIRDWIKNKFVKGNARVFYGTCDTAAATVEKAVTCADFTSADLTAGTIISVLFSNTNSGAVGSITLNVNGTGAKNIKYIRNGSLANIASAGYIKANQLYQFTYDGTYWVVQMLYDANTVNQVQKTYSSVVAGAVGIFGYTLIMQKPDGTWESIVNSYSTGTKSANTNGFLLSPIYWYYTSDTKTPGNRVGTSVINEAYPNGDLRYSFNGVTKSASTSAITAAKSVYLVGTISNGLFYLDTTKWFAQDLPTSEDGKVYIYLGEAHDAYRMDLSVQHPVYEYRNGCIRHYYGDTPTFNPLAVIQSNGSVAITLPNDFKGIVYAFRGATTMGMYMVNVSSAGAVYVCEVSSVANLALATGTNRLTLTNSSSGIATLYYIGSGTATVS